MKNQLAVWYDIQDDRKSFQPAALGQIGRVGQRSNSLAQSY